MHEAAAAGNRSTGTALSPLRSCSRWPVSKEMNICSVYNTKGKGLLRKKGNPNVSNNCRKHKAERSSNKMSLVRFLLEWNGEKAAPACQKTHVHPHCCSKCKSLLNSLWNSLRTGWPPWKTKVLIYTSQDSGPVTPHRLLQVEGQVPKSRLLIDVSSPGSDLRHRLQPESQILVHCFTDIKEPAFKLL